MYIATRIPNWMIHDFTDLTESDGEEVAKDDLGEPSNLYILYFKEFVRPRVALWGLTESGVAVPKNAKNRL